MSGSTPVLTPRSDTGSLEGRAPSPASAEKGMSCFTDGTMLVVGSHKTLARVVARTETVSRSCQPKGRPPTFLWHPLSHAQRRLAKEMPQRTATKWSPLREVPSKRGPFNKAPMGEPHPANNELERFRASLCRPESKEATNFTIHQRATRYTVTQQLSVS